MAHRKQRWGGVWSNRDFVRLWAAATVSTFGSDITLSAMPFTAILLLRATPWELGLLRIAALVPAFLIGIFAGTWLDRVPRRPVMIACDWVRAGILVSVPLAAWMADLTFTHLLIASAGLSVALTFFSIADRSLLPSLVGRDELIEANRMLTGGATAAEAMGFAASGWLVQLVSAPGALLVDSATFVWSALTLRRITRVETAGNEEEEARYFLREAFAGLRFVRGNRMLAALGTSLFGMSLSIQMVGTVYLLYVNQELGFKPGPLGIIFATGGLFSLLASITGGRVLRTVGVGPLLIGTLLVASGGQTLIALASSATLFAVIVMLLQQALDYAWTLHEITAVSARQGATPDAWQGRMNGTFHVLEFGGYLLGAIAGSWLGSTAGLRATIVAGGCGMALSAIPLLLSPARSLRDMPTVPN